VRRENLNGTYDIHTNLMQYPKIMQPTHARWERIEPPQSDEDSRRRLLASASTVLNESERPADGDTAMEDTTETSGPATSKPDAPNTVFSSLPAIFARNFSIEDIYYESPQDTARGIPGPDGDMHDLGHNGFVSASKDEKPALQVGEDILAELPPECREAYIEAAAREWEWKSRWRGQERDGYRAPLPLNYTWNP
jgi:chromatin structure-remodeling complex protein RSC7